MKIHKYNEMMKWLTRPKAKPMPITKYIDTMNRLYGNEGGAVKKAEAPHGTEPDYYPPKEMEDIKKSLNVSEMVKKEERFNDKILKRDKYAPKKITKKTLVVEKPIKPLEPIISLLELEDYLNEIDPNTWTEEESKKEVLLRVPRRQLRGLASLLNVGQEVGTHRSQ